MIESREVQEETLLAALMGISEMMGNLTDLDELLETIVRIAPRLVSVNRCAIFLRNPHTKEFRAVHAFTPDAAATALLLRVVLPEADVPRLAKKIVEQKIPVMLRESREPMLPQPVVEAFGVRSMLMVPLSYHDEVLGFLALDEPGKDHVFTSQDVNVVNAIASHAAVAIVHTRLVDAFHTERKRSEALAESLCDGVITVDRELRILSLNGGAERLLGWQSDELAGRPAASLLGGPEEPGDLVAVGRKLLLGAKRGTTRVRLRAKDGSRVACLVTAVAVEGSTGATSELVYALSRILPGAMTQRPAKTSAD